MLSTDQDKAKAGESDKGLVRRALSSWRSWLLAVLLIAAIVFAVFHWADVKKFADLVSHAQPAWLLAAVGVQLATYVALAGQWMIVLKADKSPRPFGKLLALTVTKHFADQLVPTSGMSGNVVVTDRLMSVGSSRETAVATVILAILAYYASFALAAVAVLVLLWLHGHSNWIVIGLISAFLALSAAIPTLTLWLQKKGRKAAPRWLRKFGPIRQLFDMIGDAPSELVRDPALIAAMTGLNAAVLVFDALTLLFCLFALGLDAPFAAAFAAFMMGSIVATLGPVPMGLGSFEAACIATLRIMGVPFEAALSATLLYRGFTLWLPLIPGAITTRRDLKKRN